MIEYLHIHNGDECEIVALTDPDYRTRDGYDVVIGHDLRGTKRTIEVALIVDSWTPRDCDDLGVEYTDWSGVMGSIAFVGVLALCVMSLLYFGWSALAVLLP